MPNLVEPAPGVVPPEQMMPPAAPEEAAAPAEEAAAPEMPEALMKIPAFQALFAGSPPAASYDLHDKSDREERKVAEDNAAYLAEAGFRTYKALSGDRGVIYNALRVHPEDLAAADRAGKLGTLAPDFDAINHAVSKAGLSHPIFHVGEVPNAPASPRSASIAPQSATQQAIADRISGAPQSLPPAQSIVAPASAGAQRRIASARVANMKPQAPTAGAAPGSGAILASIMKPVV